MAATRRSEPWRLRCPRGHTVIKRKGIKQDDGNQPFWACQTCLEQGRDHRYQTVVDVKTDTEVSP